MAQFVGTGKDPRFVKGQPFDIPDGDPEQQKLIEDRGLGERVHLVGQTGPPDPAQRAVELAGAKVRDDPMTHPQDRAVRDALDIEDAHEIAEVHDKSAVTKGAAKAVEKAAGEHPPEEGAAPAHAKAGTEGQAERAREDKQVKDDESKSAGQGGKAEKDAKSKGGKSADGD